MSLGYPPVLPAILEQHFEELDFLLERREGILFSPNYTLPELAEHEQRIDAHLDGMTASEMHGIERARPALSGAEPFAAAAATLTLSASGVGDLADTVMDAFEQAESKEARDGIRIGLRLSPVELFQDRLTKCSESDDPALASAAIDVLAFQGIPVTGVRRLLEAPEGADRALMYGALGRQRRLDRDDLLRRALADPESTVCIAALRAAALSGLSGLGDLCRESARQAASPECVEFLGVVGGPGDLDMLDALVSDDSLGSAALSALGGLGSVVPVPRLIQLMSEDGATATSTATSAAAAFLRITGAENLEADPVEPAAEQDSEAANPDGRSDEERFDAEFEDTGSLPDAGKASAWWSQNEARFPAPGRYQLGHEVSGALGTPLMHALSLDVRRDLLLAAALAGQAVPGLDLEARAHLQWI